MVTRHAKIAALMGAAMLSAPMASAERPACPTGETDGWRWQVNATYIQLVHGTFEVDWDTAGVDKTSAGMEITVTMDLDEVIRSVSFNFAPLDFHISQKRAGSDDWKVSLFDRLESGETFVDAVFKPYDHDFYGAGYDASGEELTPVFSSRVEQWGTKDFEVPISWNGFDHPVDWTFTDHTQLRLGLSTTLFSPYGARKSWSLVGLSGPLDLTALKPVIADARAAQASMTGNRMCDMNYEFGL